MLGQNVWNNHSGSHAAVHGHESAIRTGQGFASELGANAQDFASHLADVVESAKSGVMVEELSERLNELLPVFCEEMPASHFTKLQRALSDTLTHLRSQAAELVSLRTAVEALQRKAAEAEADRRAVLLGQLVYTADIIATSYVFGAGSRPISLSDIQIAVEDDTGAQQRWQQVATFAEKQGVSITQLINRSSALRSQRFAVAHGRPDELDSTTPDQLREWATSSYAKATELLLQFLGPLTLAGRPLRPRQDVAATFAAAVL